MFHDFYHIGEHRFSVFLELGGAVLAHIQIVTDQKTPVADETLTYRAVIQMLRRIPSSDLPCTVELLFVNCIIYDLFALRRRFYTRFGKANRFIGKFRSAGIAGNTKQKYLLGGQVLQ